MWQENLGSDTVRCSECQTRFIDSSVEPPLVRLGENLVCKDCFRLKTQRNSLGSVQTPLKRQRPQRQRKRRLPEDAYEVMSRAEETDLKIALKNSVATSVSETYSLEDIPLAPTYHPTEEEFKYPLKYMKNIRSEASKHGICTIVPPASWSSPEAFADSSKYGKFHTRKQFIHRLQEAFGVENGNDYTIDEYKEMADKFKSDYFSQKPFNIEPGQKVPTKLVEEEFWRVVTTPSNKLEVEYGSDVDSGDFGSGFPPKGTKGNQMWNLNELPLSPGSVLSQLSDITGVTVPWVYFGMVFSSFCWHNEDNYLYSTSFCHKGDPKVWYGVPGSHAEKLEKVMKEAVPELFKDEPDLMMKLVTMIAPQLLMANGVPIYKIIQQPGEFVVTFPKAYHGGFNSGFNCNEAVNFATDEWFAMGRQATDRYRDFGRGSVFSHHQLLLQNAIRNSGQHDYRTLLKAIAAMRDEEKWLRETAWKAGISTCNKIRSNSPIAECDICQHFCFLSSLSCSCNENRHVCLEHGEHLCDCDPKDKSMSYRHTMGQLSAFIRKFEEYSKEAERRGWENIKQIDYGLDVSGFPLADDGSLSRSEKKHNKSRYSQYGKTGQKRLKTEKLKFKSSEMKPVRQPSLGSKSSFDGKTSSKYTRNEEHLFTESPDGKKPQKYKLDPVKGNASQYQRDSRPMFSSGPPPPHFAERQSPPLEHIAPPPIPNEETLRNIRETLAQRGVENDIPERRQEKRRFPNDNVPQMYGQQQAAQPVAPKRMKHDQRITLEPMHHRVHS